MLNFPTLTAKIAAITALWSCKRIVKYLWVNNHHDAYDSKMAQKNKGKKKKKVTHSIHILTVFKIREQLCFWNK